MNSNYRVSRIVLGTAELLPTLVRKSDWILARVATRWAIRRRRFECMLHEGLTTGQAAKYISRHPKTLQAMDRAGVLPARRTASGRRYWLRPDLDRYLGRTGEERPRRTVCYCRVASQAQRAELKNQRRIVEEFAIAKGVAKLEFIEEMGDGLNCQRPKFTALVDSVVDEVAMLVVAHPGPVGALRVRVARTSVPRAWV